MTLLDILQGTLGTGLNTSLGAMGQGMSVARPEREPRRRPRPSYTPQDQAVLQLVQQHLASGLDPSIAAQVIGGVESDLDARLAAYRQRQAMRRERMQTLLPEIGGQAAELAAAGVPQAALETMYSGYGGQLGNRVDTLVSSLYGGQGATTLDPESVAGIGQAVVDMTAEGLPLSRARMAIIGQMRAEGSSDAEIQQAQDYIGQQYQALAPELMDAAAMGRESHRQQLEDLGLLGLSGSISTEQMAQAAPTAVEGAQARASEIQQAIDEMNRRRESYAQFGR